MRPQSCTCVGFVVESFLPIMPREIITLQVGQCGNQSEYKSLCSSAHLKIKFKTAVLCVLAVLPPSSLARVSLPEMGWDESCSKSIVCTRLTFLSPLEEKDLNLSGWVAMLKVRAVI